MTDRPKRGETEDDLLEFQTQFLASRNNPSATVVRVSKDVDHTGGSQTGDKRTETTMQRDVVDLHGLPQSLPSSLGDFGPPKKKSKFKEKRMGKKNKTDATGDDTDEDAAELLDRHDRHISSVLTEIRERDIQRSKVLMPAKVVHRGFPEALHRGNIIAENQDTNNQSRKSIFAQHFKASNPTVFGLPQKNSQDLPLTVNDSEYATNRNNKPTQQTSKLVTGEGLVTSASEIQHSAASREVERIHQENMERLSAMTEEEILQEQERLRKSIDPSLFNFLKSKHHKKSLNTETSTQEHNKMELQEAQPVVSSTDSETKVMSDLIQTSQANESKDVVMDNVTSDSNTATMEKHVHFNDNVKVIKQEDTETEKITEVEELTEMAATQNWVNMDTIETEKLEWMKECSKPTAVRIESGKQARFAFDGNLITRDVDIPVNVGLHHHGNEPEAAGYTLEELFMLTRSSFLQQRVVAIQTLARIVTQDTQGSFTDVLQTSVLSTLLDAGIIFLLRWALDDTADAVIAVTVQCLSYVLVVPSEQEYADQVCEWYRGQELPSLRPAVEEKTEDKNNDEDEDEARKHETDAEIVKKDVIKGLLQMSILPRLRYILEVCRPTPATVRGIFTILTRIAQHSTEAAHEITKCPRMLDSIFSKFLPVSWKKVDMALEDVTDMYGLPSPEALRLLRHISSGGRHLTSLLISKHHLMDVILCYTSLHPKHMQLSYYNAVDLCIESFRLWTVCISYGLACNQFRENFSTLLQHIQKFQDLSFVKNNASTETVLECHRACAMMKMLEEVIHVAGTSAELHAKMTASSPDHHKESEADCLPPPPVNWSHVMGFMPLVVFALTKLKAEVISVEESSFDTILDCHILRFTSMCNLLASFYSKLQSQPSFSPVESLEDIEDLVANILLPVVNSAFMGNIIKHLGKISMTSSNIRFTRGIASLPDYGTLLYRSHPETNPPSEYILHGTAVAFMTSFTHLLCSIIKVHKGIASKFLTFVTREEMIEYVTQISSSQEILCQSFFGRFEHHLHYFTIKLFYSVAMSVDFKDMTSTISAYHTAALVVFSRLRAGDEYYAHDLMSTVLFNPDVYPEASDHTTTSVAKELSEMKIGSQGMPTAPQLLTKDNRLYTQKELLCEAHKNLLAIRSTYMGSFGKVRHALAASRSLALHQPHDIQSLLLPPSTGPFLPADWMFVPIIDLHNQTISAEMKGHGVDEVPPAMVSTVMCTLQMILMLEEWRPVSLASVTMVAKITRLMCIFLTGSDLFFDRFVHYYVRSLLVVYTRPSCLSRLDFSGNVAGLSSFYDLYKSLLSHYSAVSFGDPLFASFLVLPLAQRHHIKFRHALWDEYVGTIRAVSFPINQVPIPLDHFLYPIEQDDVLLYLYLRALANQQARPRWCPFFYLVAIHHVNAFIYQGIDPKDTMLLKRKLSLLNHVMQVKIQGVRNDLLYYYKPLPDSSSDKAFEVFTSLPPDREILLRNRQDFEQCKKLYETMSSAQ